MSGLSPTPLAQESKGEQPAKPLGVDLQFTTPSSTTSSAAEQTDEDPLDSVLNQILEISNKNPRQRPDPFVDEFWGSSNKDASCSLNDASSESLIESDWLERLVCDSYQPIEDTNDFTAVDLQSLLQTSADFQAAGSRAEDNSAAAASLLEFLEVLGTEFSNCDTGGLP
ncbi:hypothetical protein HDU83_004248 [Entophlyctis luteolus]|nr:hypothetical protein HDU83_004248 [Entophlyctis luteolus]